MSIIEASQSLDSCGDEGPPETLSSATQWYETLAAAAPLSS